MERTENQPTSSLPSSMNIENFRPEIVLAKATLRERLVEVAAVGGLGAEQARALIASIPSPLADAEAFLDRDTTLWRYEFGEPFRLEGELVVGTHMWPPVEELYSAVSAAVRLLPADKLSAYMAVLNDTARHPTALAEMMPVARVPADTQVAFEVAGHGPGNTTVDWVIEVSTRRLLLDAKSRTADFIKQVRRADVEGFMPEPDHDHSLLFKSLEKKFHAADPDAQLQGAWVTTHIKQNVYDLQAAFDVLDASKVHFAVLGDWSNDATLLVRREQDSQFILDTLRIERSSRFVFQPQ